MTDDQQRARELLAIHLEAEGYFIAEQIRAGNVPTYELVVINAITAALRAAPEGFVLVPVEASVQMKRVGGFNDHTWRSVLAVARPQETKA